MKFHRYKSNNISCWELFQPHDDCLKFFKTRVLHFGAKSNDCANIEFLHTIKVLNDDDGDSLLHIFALKMSYNMFKLAIKKY